jgi:hypothetical protein
VIESERLNIPYIQDLLTPERESVCGELLICHLSVHIISFEDPLKKRKRKKRKEGKEVR